jgi:hypothetical protein
MIRIKMIEIEVEKFSKKSKLEKKQFLNDVKDICTHNQNLFLSLGTGGDINNLEKNIELNKCYSFLIN